MTATDAEGGATGGTGATTTARGAAAPGTATLVAGGGGAAATGAAFDMTRRDASTANTAPMAAAPITQAALGRSRTTITVGSAVRGERLMGASDPGAVRGTAIIGLERRTNAAGRADSCVDEEGA